MIRAVLEHVRLRSPLSPSALRAALAEIVEPTPWPPRLVFKLSGGGIVSRVMAAPETSLPFFGLVSDEKIRIARATRGRQVTPFQPILLGTITAADDGSALTLQLRPHREARSLSGLFGVAGFVLIGAALPALLEARAMGVIGLLFGAAFMVFPTWRARTCFAADHRDALAALHESLPLTAEAP
jgi:hypothetical protein